MLCLFHCVYIAYCSCILTLATTPGRLSISIINQSIFVIDVVTRFLGHCPSFRSIPQRSVFITISNQLIHDESYVVIVDLFKMNSR